MNCDNYGWPIFMPTGEARLYDGVIDTGRCFIESTDGLLYKAMVGIVIQLLVRH